MYGKRLQLKTYYKWTLYKVFRFRISAGFVIFFFSLFQCLQPAGWTRIKFCMPQFSRSRTILVHTLFIVFLTLIHSLRPNYNWNFYYSRYLIVLLTIFILNIFSNISTASDLPHHPTIYWIDHTSSINYSEFIIKIIYCIVVFLWFAIFLHKYARALMVTRAQ